jgi:hypothetical protein
MAQKVNIVIDQGTTFNTSFTILTDNGDPIDFTNYTAQSQLRKSYSSSTSFAFGVTLTSLGVVALSMNAATTGSITAGRYVYDVESVDASGTVIRLVEGIVTVTPQVTR